MKEINGIQTRKKKIKILLFSDILYIKDQNLHYNSTTSKHFWQAANLKINIWKLIVFLYIKGTVFASENHWIILTKHIREMFLIIITIKLYVFELKYEICFI